MQNRQQQQQQQQGQQREGISASSRRCSYASDCGARKQWQARRRQARNAQHNWAKHTQRRNKTTDKTLALGRSKVGVEPGNPPQLLKQKLEKPKKK